MTRYMVTDANDCVDSGELVMDTGGKPYLFYQDAIWTAADAARKGLRFERVPARDPYHHLVDAIADQIWAEAILEAKTGFVARSVKRASRLFGKLKAACEFASRSDEDRD